LAARASRQLGVAFTPLDAKHVELVARLAAAALHA
jgi:hypothetical protein